MEGESTSATAAPSAGQALPTEEEHRQAKLDKAAESGDVGSDVQPNAKAAADQLAAVVAPTPAIPARPETATPPVNVAQRQRAGLQPLPTDEELEELAIEAGGVVDLAKKFFWIADDAGEPSIDSGTNSVFLHYPDGSQISVKFEYRPGDFQSVGAAAATPEEATARNKKFADAKKVREDRRKDAQENAKREAESDQFARSSTKQGVPAEPVPVPVES